MIEVRGEEAPAPLDDITDIYGLARIFIPSSYANCPGVLIVEAAGYEKHRQHIDLTMDALPDVVQLKPAPTTTSTLTMPLTSTPVLSPIPDPPATDTSVATTMPTRRPTTPVPTTPAVSLAPVLLGPEDGIHASGNLVFSWTWYKSLNDEGPYNGEYFALRVWHEGADKKSITWTKETSYEVEFREHGLGASGRYYWNVAVVRQTGPDSSQHWERVSPESETRWFSVEPPKPDPTSLPPPTTVPCPPNC